MKFYFRNTKKEDITRQEDEEHQRNTKVCWFCETDVGSFKVWDHCHLTIMYRVPAHKKRNTNVKQKQGNLVLFAYLSLSNDDCDLFVKMLIDMKEDEVTLDFIPKPNEEQSSVASGCIQFIDSNRFLSKFLDELVKILVDNNHETLKNVLKKWNWSYIEVC